MPTIADLQEALTVTGISAFGLSMPVLSPNWTDVDTNLPTVNSAGMSLNLADGSWQAPVDGTLFKMESDIIGATLTQPDGSTLTGPGLLLTLPPQLYLRLNRLYARIIEGTDVGLPVRPVPRYFFYQGSVDALDVGGNIHAGDDIGQNGAMTVYDTDGHPIDPLSVASVFQLIFARHRLLQARSIGAPFEVAPQLSQIIDLGGASAIRIRLSDAAGAPVSNERFAGLTVIDETHTANGIFGLASLSTNITITPPSDEFPEERRRLLRVGPATTGNLGVQFVPTPLAAGASPPVRDFFSVRAIDLGPYLLGSPNVEFFGHAHEQKPVIRINEAVLLRADGNDLLAAANDALAGNPDEALVVAQAIASDFELPSTPGAAARFPAFPPLGAVVSAVDGPLPVNLRDSFNPTAQFVDDGDPATANIDVALTLNGLPLGAAVRVYNRKFVFDAREERGDGAGGIVTSPAAIPGTGTLTLLLRDPFSLRRPGIPENATSVPVDPILRTDVVIVKQGGESRIYGNVEAKVAAAAAAVLPAPVSNRFAGSAVAGGLPRRGVSNAGILGLKAPPVEQPLGLNPLDAAISSVLQLAGETDPRDAPRLPTMARRDLLVAGRAGGNWKAVLSGGRLTSEAHSADPRRGSPGSPGGRETQLVGLSTQNGRLAYDIARMAFRRTTQIVPRMIALAQSRWNEPSEPAAGNGSFAAAVLQNIAPGCETPEFGPLRTVLEANIDDLPATFDELVDQVSDFLDNALEPVINRFPNGPIKTELENRRNQLRQALEDLRDDNTLDESVNERLFNELHRELLSSTHGRRDTQWALDAAIARARRFVYIESPGFAPTRRDYDSDVPPVDVPPYATNLMARIAVRLAEVPGLQVMVCTMPHPAFVQLSDGVQCFHVIREMLVAGGLGRIARLWNGKIPNAPEIEPAAVQLANPDGLEFDVLGALLISLLADRQSF